MSKNVEALTRQIQTLAGDTPPDLGLILGSGLGHLVDMVEGVKIPYSDLVGFPHASVSGHSPQLAIGQLEGRRVLILGGRVHYYEQGQADAMHLPLEVFKALGGSKLLITNAAGSLTPACRPGDVMLINDHINFSGRNPLIGVEDDARFVPMKDAYNPVIRDALRRAAVSEGIDLPEGVYAWYSGPSFETPAEIRAIRILGADAVGMSTVPEVTLCRFLGLEVAAVSVITNMAAGLPDEAISHAHTKAMAPLGAQKFESLLRHYLKNG